MYLAAKIDTQVRSVLGYLHRSYITLHVRLVCFLDGSFIYSLPSPIYCNIAGTTSFVDGRALARAKLGNAKSRVGRKSLTWRISGLYVNPWKFCV